MGSQLDRARHASGPVTEVVVHIAAVYGARRCRDDRGGPSVSVFMNATS